MGLPVAVRIIVRTSAVLELEAELVGAWLQRLQFFVEEIALACGLPISLALCLNLLRRFCLVVEARVSRPDQSQGSTSFSGFRHRLRHEWIKEGGSIFARHATVPLDRFFGDMAAFATIVACRSAILEIHPIPTLEGRLIGKLAESHWIKPLELAAGSHPGAADRFPVRGTTLR